MKDLELRLTDLLARKADEVDVRPVDGFAEIRYPATIELDPTNANPAQRQHRRRVAQGILVVATVAAAVGIMAVALSRNDRNVPVDTPIPVGPTISVDTSEPAAAPPPLSDPSLDDVALASNASVYRPSNGPTAVTDARSYVLLRKCIRAVNGMPDEPCDGPESWAYVTGSADSPAVHYGLLGFADGLVLSSLDDRYFVASAPASLSADASTPPAAWLIDSMTGQRGVLTWQDQPTTLNSAEQALVLFPAPDPIPNFTGPGTGFLPRVVDRRDWTIRPLSVPDDASAALAIHQPGSGRIWIGTAPDGGDVGLAYTDDGGASWTDVRLPESQREEWSDRGPDQDDDVLMVAATGDHVAATAAWSSDSAELVVSADAGKSWNTVPVDPADGNGRRLFVLDDQRLMLVMSMDAETNVVHVSRSASDWSQLEEADGVFSELLTGSRTTVDVYQHGLVIHHNLGPLAPMNPPMMFSTDLDDWWTIPGLEDPF